MNKQTTTILAIIAVVVVIAIAALAFRNQNTPDSASPTGNNTMMEDDKMEGDSMEGDSMMMELDAAEDGVYTVNAEDSTMEWEGRKTLVANYTDSGTISIQSGNFNVAHGTISGGTVVFDMESIKTTFVTMTSLGTESLTRHLKSPDFFDVENHPTATFTVIGSEAGEKEGMLNVRGNLTIKGNTHEITIPVQLGMKDGQAVVTGTATVDRTLYDVRFGSDKFFDNLANNVIDDFFTLSFMLKADAS